MNKNLKFLPVQNDLPWWWFYMCGRSVSSIYKKRECFHKLLSSIYMTTESEHRFKNRCIWVSLSCEQTTNIL